MQWRKDRQERPLERALSLTWSPDCGDFETVAKIIELLPLSSKKSQQVG